MTDTPTPEPTEPSPRSRSVRVRGVLRTLLHVLGVLAVLALVAPFAVYAMPGLIGADVSYVVLSDSMQPAFGVNDVVVVDRVDPATVQPGDVITFARTAEDPPVTHRVVDRVDAESGPAFVTKGDANEEADARPVPYSAVVGRVVLTLPYVGYVVGYVGTDVGFALLVLLPIALLALGEAARFLRPDPRTAPDASAASGPGVAPAATDAAVAAAVDAVEGTDGANDGTTGGEQAAAPATALDQPAGFTLTRADLGGTSAALLLLAVYAGYVGFTTQDVPSVMVAAGAAVVALLALGARLTWQGSATVRPGGRAAPLVAAALPPATLAAPRVTVDSLDALLALADATRHPVVHDAVAGAYALVDGDVVYWCDAPEDSPDDADATAVPDVPTDATGSDSGPDADAPADWPVPTDPDSRHPPDDGFAADGSGRVEDRDDA